MKLVICPYCRTTADLVSGGEVYPHRPDLHEKWFYRCTPCDARVGCHPDTKEPLGRMANAELRVAKMEAHEYFDMIWKRECAGLMKRKEAYAWLAGAMGIDKNDCHIGMFDLEQCKRVVELSKDYLGLNG